MAVEKCRRGRMARQTFGSLVSECKRSACQDSEEAGTKWKRFKKEKEKEKGTYKMCCFIGSMYVPGICFCK